MKNKVPEMKNKVRCAPQVEEHSMKCDINPLSTPMGRVFRRISYPFYRFC